MESFWGNIFGTGNLLDEKEKERRKPAARKRIKKA